MQSKQLQHGLTLMVLMFILALAAITYTMHAIDKGGVDQRRQQKTTESLAEAKAALLGSVIGAEYMFDSSTGDYLPPYLPNPDLASPLTNDEGNESLAFGSQDFSILGKLPWKSLKVPAFRDGWGECLWYVVSGRFKKAPATQIYNWDTVGQINIIDENGVPVTNNLAALIISPGSQLVSQDRSLLNVKYSQCGGNYDPKNYLDTYDVNDATNGEVNYFVVDTTDARRAGNTNNKTFVLANNQFYNDKFIKITVDDVFDFLIKRSDFIDGMNNQIGSAVSDIDAAGLAPIGAKGTDGFVCSASSNPTFCQNWKEMFLLADVASGVTVNGSVCSSNTVLIFGGKKTGGQQRLTAAHKDDPANYLEGDNLNAFNGVAGANYQGPNDFDGNNPSADIVRCVE